MRRTDYMNPDVIVMFLSAVGKTSEEGYDVCNPIMHVGARLGRIRDDPDNDENYCSPGQDLRYQSFSPPPSGEYLCLQMPSLAEVTGMASLRVLRGPGYQPLFGCWRVDLATASARSIAPPWWADASADLHRIFGQRGCQGGSPDGPVSIAHPVYQTGVRTLRHLT